MTRGLQDGVGRRKDTDARYRYTISLFSLLFLYNECSRVMLQWLIVFLIVNNDIFNILHLINLSEVKQIPNLTLTLVQFNIGTYYRHLHTCSMDNIFLKDFLEILKLTLADMFS